MKHSTIAVIAILIILSIVTVQEESTLAAVVAITCLFYLIGKFFHSIDIWLGDVEEVANNREI